MSNIIDKYTLSSKKVPYGDFKPNLNVHPGSKDIQVLSETDTIKSCIINILKTKPYERPFQPTLGSMISSLLFENITEQTLLFAQQIIKDAVATHEPRARVETVTVSPTEQDNGIYITIVFYILNSNNPITIDLVLNKVR
jgi:phage baseplate assembly protein W